MGGFEDRAEIDRGKGGGHGWLAPVLVNLGLGVPAALPLWLARWLVTEYLPMDCRTASDVTRTGLTDCDLTVLDHAGPVMLALAATGMIFLATALFVDVLLPLRRGANVGRWLGTAVLIPVPFAACLALAR